MKTIKLLALFCFLSYKCYSQVQGLTQSAEGKSTIPIRGTAVGIDLAKTELSFGYNNLNTIVQTRRVKPVFGLNVSVKNEEGLGNLFNSGDIVASGKGYMYSGLTFSNAFNKSEIAALTKRKKITDAFNTSQKNFRAGLSQEFQNYINKAVLTITNVTVRARVTGDLNTELTGVKGNEETFYDKINSKTNADMEAQLVYDDIASFAQIKKAEFQKRKKDYTKRLNELHKQFTNSSFQRFTIFGFGGISAIGFKQFLGVDSSNLSSSFKAIDERGGEFGMGINYQVRNVWFGITYSRVSGNNFSLLTKKEYTLRQTTSLTPQALIEETKVNGYSGKFGEVKYTNLNADIVLRLKLDKEFKNFLLVNPYLRGSIQSADTSLLTNKVNLGSGLYFLSNESKFLGGIYLELPDVHNNAEKKKPAEDQNLRPPFKRLSFGVVAKFNLNSIMGW